MVKSGYVNNLADMREQLRRNYRNPDDALPSPRQELAVPETSPSENTPARSVRSEALRDFRDLEGRVLSALALIECEIEKTEFSRDRLVQRREKLQSILQEMQQASIEKGEAERQVDLLRYRFFEIAVPVCEEDCNHHPEKKDAQTLRNALVVASAILAGAVIVALAFVFSL